MQSSKQNTITSSLIILLLLVQVILSALIIERLNDNDQTLSSINRGVSQTAWLITGAQQQEATIYVEGISTDDDPWQGDETASITIVEFADYECPACAVAVPMVEAILEKYKGEIRFVYRDYPLSTIR